MVDHIRGMLFCTGGYKWYVIHRVNEGYFHNYSITLHPQKV